MPSTVLNALQKPQTEPLPRGGAGREPKEKDEGEHHVGREGAMGRTTAGGQGGERGAAAQGTLTCTYPVSADKSTSESISSRWAQAPSE